MSTPINLIEEMQRVPENKLTPDREAELKEHFKTCPNETFLVCALCKELYNNIGYAAYEKLFKELPPEDQEYPAHL